MEDKIKELRLRILPILLYCQANKGDLNLSKNWRNQDDAGKKFFYAYYSGLFCRILYMLETRPVFRHFVRDCEVLLDKYNWYDIQEKDLELCRAAGSFGCEVPDALEFTDAIDKVIWNISNFRKGDAVCLKHGSWSFADVRGGIKS